MSKSDTGAIAPTLPPAQACQFCGGVRRVLHEAGHGDVLYECTSCGSIVWEHYGREWLTAAADRMREGP